MKRPSARLWGAVLLLASTAFSQQAAKPIQYGIVKGLVVNESGNPVAGARVTADPVDYALAAILPTTTSDEQGSFVLPRVLAGRNAIFATKEEAGYIDEHWGADPGKVPLVNVAANQIVANVTIRLRKGGSLGGAVFDCQTGLPLLAATVTLTRVDIPSISIHISLQKGGSFHFVLPALPFRLKTVADGYIDWHYPPPSSQQKDFIIPVGQRKTLAVDLHPIGGQCK